MADLVLTKGSERRLKSGHVWIYSNEVDTKQSPLPGFQPGEQVRVVTATGKPMGTAFVNPHTLICGRLISRNPDATMNARLVRERLQTADKLRLRRFDKPFYRLAFGDSDGLPGLVVDRFDQTAVVQISTAGMEGLVTEVAEALKSACGIQRVILKNDGKMRETEGLASYVECLDGPMPASLAVEENGVRFEIDAAGGQKTGWFYDHRENRHSLKPYVSDARVLDVFSYVGGWGVQAAVFGAREVICVDSSTTALDQVARNAALNGIEQRVSSLAGDAFTVMKSLCEERERFDVVIVDPPALIPRKKDIKAGEAAYQRLNQLALRLLNPDGILVSASCSMHLKRDSLLEILRNSGRTIDRFVQVLEQGHQSPDHPILPAVPETEYIKSFTIRSLATL